MRCDRCAHWKLASENEEWEARRSGFGECTAVRERWVLMDEASRAMQYGSGDEDWDEFGDNGPPPNSFTGVRIEALKRARAYVQDGSQYRAELFTAPDFFCALFAQGMETGTAETRNEVPGEA